MADDCLGEYASLSTRVSISSSEADRSQGTSSSSQVSSSFSWLGMVIEGASSMSSDLLASTPKANSTSSELVDCN
eukprot:2168733-Ditylum_brightwellii.AAC.1